MKYEYADKMIRDMNRRNLRAFDRLKLLPFDELNIVRSVTKVYKDSERIARKRYLQIARDAYAEATGKKAEDAITEDWILDMLEEYDPVTLYQFLPEADRKNQRLIEAMVASHNKNEEVDKALRFWTLQVTQYAIKSVDDATIDGYKAVGVKKVRWVAEDDEKTCSVCKKRDGKVYAINKLPNKPHYNCRCTFIPVMD